MSNVKLNSDPLALVHDDDLRQIVDKLDRVRIGLTDMQAAPALNDAPELQDELCSYARIIRLAADLIFHFRVESHHLCAPTRSCDYMRPVRL